MHAAHPRPLRTRDVGVGIVAHVRGVPRFGAEGGEGAPEDLRVRLAVADLVRVRDDREVPEQTVALEDLAEDDAWQDVALRASLLHEDMQGVFMMIARAAKEGWPCPSDAAIARAYGSHSLRRAQRLLTYIEDQGLIVCQLDGAGRRIVTLVELAWATAPRDPNADDPPPVQGCDGPPP